MLIWDNALSEIIAVNTSDGFIVLPVRDIVYCESKGGSTMVCLASQKDAVSLFKTLKALQAHLPEAIFIKVHQQYLINKLHVRRFSRTGEGYVLMSNGKRLPVSTRKRQDLLNGFARF